MKTNRIVSLIACSLSIASVSSCVVDKDYAFNDINEIDTEVTLFEKGVDIPVGKTEQFHLADVLKMVKDSSLTDFLKEDGEGKYSITASGNYDMTDVIAQMELEKLLDLDGASFSQNIEYPIGDIDKDKLTIKGKTFSYQLPGFDPFSLDDIKIPAITCPEQVIYTELYKYMPEGVDIGAQIPSVDRTEGVVDASSMNQINSAISALPIGQTDEVPVQTILSGLGLETVTFSGAQEEVNASIGLGEKASSIADVNNFKLQAGAKIKISLSVENCPLTKGTITPSFKANLSNMVNLDGASLVTGDIDLSSMVLTQSNGWSSEKVYSINSLAEGFPAKKNDKLVIVGTIDVKSGNISISDAKSTKAQVSSVAGKSMTLRVKVSFNDVVLESMDITLGNNVGFDFDPVQMPVDFSFDMPKELKKVDKIILDQNKPMLLEIKASNLSGIKTDDDHLSLIPEVEITFPDGLEVQEADPVTHKLTVTGDLYTGNISKQIHVLSLTPACAGGKISFTGDVKATIKAKAQGKFNSKTLPKSSTDDVVLKGKITCEPKISDFNAILDLEKVTQKIDQKEEFSIDVKGLADFGEFEIYPKTACSAKVVVDIPQLTELNVIADKIVITLPEMLVVDGNQISGFNPSDNTITISGQIPSQIEIPVKYLKVKPTTDPGGSTKITGYLTIVGTITVDQDQITNTSIKELSFMKAGLNMEIPTIEAGSMKMTGDFNKSLDYECKDVVFLDKTTMSKLPKEVIALKDVEFKSVNAIVQITLNGLPDLKSSNYFHLLNTSVVLPDFLTAHDGSNTIVFDKDIKVANNTAVLTKAVLGGIKDVNLEGLKELKGDIVLNCTLFSEKPDVDLQTLQSKIVGTVKVAIGDGTGILNPGKIAIEKAVVNVSYDVAEESIVKIGDNIPEELQAEDVNLALDPEIKINLKTNFGAPLVGNFKFVPYIKGQAVEDCIVEVKDIAMPVSEDASEVSTTYIIGSNPGASQSGVVPVVCDLSPLMRRVPDEIKLSIHATIDKAKDCIIYPAADYTCNMDYSFNVPLCFGDDMNLHMSSMLEVESDVSEYFQYGSVRLNLDIVNTLPLGVKCDIKLLDDKGAEVPIKYPITVDIQPGDGQTAKEQSFHPELSLADPASKPVIRNISLSFATSATEGISVAKDQYLQVTKLTVSVPEGITVKPELAK